MLGRIASAATVAALPWAGVLVAASSGALLWVGLGSAVTLTILLWGFAPHIPYLRRLVPGVRHASRLEAFWKAGKLLTREVIESEDDLRDWTTRQVDWSAGTSAWIEGQIGAVEAERFRAPSMSSVSFTSMFNEAHNSRLILVTAQLNKLLRLRDEQLARLK